MNFKQWFSIHKPSAHAISAASVALTTLFATNTAFRAWVMNLYTSTPTWAHDAIAGLIIPVFTYWRTQKSAVAVVEAQPGESGMAAAAANVTGDKK